jgi:hypothetical protein
MGWCFLPLHPWIILIYPHLSCPPRQAPSKLLCSLNFSPALGGISEEVCVCVCVCVCVFSPLGHIPLGFGLLDCFDFSSLLGSRNLQFCRFVFSSLISVSFYILNESWYLNFFQVKTNRDKTSEESA